VRNLLRIFGNNFMELLVRLRLKRPRWFMAAWFPAIIKPVFNKRSIGSSIGPAK
jgi:hypothetical protein